MGIDTLMAEYPSYFRREEVTLGMTKQEGRELLDVDEKDSEEIARNAQLYVPSLKVFLLTLYYTTLKTYMCYLYLGVH